MKPTCNSIRPFCCVQKPKKKAIHRQYEQLKHRQNTTTNAKDVAICTAFASYAPVGQRALSSAAKKRPCWFALLYRGICASFQVISTPLYRYIDSIIIFQFPLKT